MEKSGIMQFSFGYLHPPQMRFAGYIVIAVGFGAVVTGRLLGLLALVFGYWLTFRSSGTEIDILTRRYRPFTRSFGVKKGKWQSYASYPDLAVLRGKEGFTAYSRGMVELNMAETVYDIYLLSEDHRRKLILNRCSSTQTAEDEGKELAEQMGLSWTSYNPKLSQATRLKRRWS